MSLITKIPIQNALKKRRIPNAFMLFVREQKKHLVKTCPGESTTVIGAMLGKKWKSMALEEKQVYYDKYNTLKERYVDESDLNSHKEEIPMDKDLVQEVDEITKMHSDVAKADFQTSKIKKKMKDSFKITLLRDDPSESKKYKTRLKSNSSGSETPLDSKKKDGKPSRFKNPFLIFAKEQRGNIKSTKYNHASTILGNMWHDMDISEKQKYLEKAKQLSIGKISGSPPDAIQTKGRGKKKNKTKVPRTAAKKEKTAAPPKNVMPDNPPNGDNAVSIESVSSQYPSTSHPQDSTPSTVGCQQSQYGSLQNTPCLNELNSTSMAHYAPYLGMGGFCRPPYNGYPNGFYPHDPFPYPAPFWMYQQTMAAPYGCFSGAPCQSYCHCGFSYRGSYPCTTSHFRSVVYGSSQGAYGGTPPAPSATSTADTSISSDGAARNGNTDNDYSNALSDDSDRLVIVDEAQLEDTNQPSRQE